MCTRGLIVLVFICVGYCNNEHPIRIVLRGDTSGFLWHMPTGKGIDEWTGPFEITPQRFAEWDGFLMDILNEVIIRRQWDRRNLTMVIHNHVNGTWNDLVYEVKAGKWDLAACSFAVSSVRRKLIDFTTPFHFYFSALMHTQPYKPPLILLAPFTYWLWGCIVMLLVGCSLSLWISERHTQASDGTAAFQNTSSLTSEYLGAMWVTCSMLFDTQDREVVSTAGRVSVFLWQFVTLVLSTAYMAKVIAFLLSAEQFAPTYESFAKQRELGVINGTFQHTMALAKGWEHKIVNTPQTVTELFDGLNRDYEAAIATTITAHRGLGCNVTIIPNFAQTIPLAFATPKSSTWHQQLNHNVSKTLLELSRDGTLDSLALENFQSTICRSPGHYQVTLPQLQGPALLISMGIAVVVVQLAVALYIRRRERRKGIYVAPQIRAKQRESRLRQEVAECLRELRHITKHSQNKDTVQKGK